MMTAALAAQSPEFKTEAFRKTFEFTAFNEDNDPHGEHDYGSFDVQGQKVMFKIDYYEKGSEFMFGAETPWDESKTDRVLTLMMASDY